MQRIPAGDAFYGFSVSNGRIKFWLHISLFYYRLRKAELAVTEMTRTTETLTNLIARYSAHLNVLFGVKPWITNHLYV